MNAVNSQRLQIPPGFTEASSAYRLKVWTAMLGLIVFLLLYISLAGWFSYTAYRMIAGVFAGGDGAVAAFFAAIPSAFLAIFMWKALFFVRQGSPDPGLEITADDQPELFAFLYDLADEIGAPRPNRVFLSPNVNACVFYDLSILNFFLPSKKNLIIGLGLVNVLTRSEFRAVLAHEFGHFAQRSMAVGRWVYVGEQIAAHIIAKRDALDRTLDFISHIDLRVAWIGWIMRTIVWSIRSLIETVFRWVVIAHRALSRDMEFQADLVAVSVTGSDALVDALYRLQPADEDWERSLSFANAQLGKGKKVTDLFEVQTQIGEHMRRVLNEPRHGLLPEEAGEEPATRRLFTEQIAQPPRMWSTHPPNTEREENAKKIYIHAPREDETAWTLFAGEGKLREDVSAFLFKGIEFEKEPEPLAADEAMAALDESFSHESYDNRYQGTYLGRWVAIGVPRVQGLYGDPPADQELSRSLEQLYPKTLHDLLTEWRNLEEEIASLEAIESGYFDATGGVIRHRGEVIPRTELSEVIARVKQERDEVVKQIEEHDRNCRTVHQEAAEKVQEGWPAYLKSLTALLHYAEHGEADLSDAHGHLANITMMSTAGGHVSKAKLKKILASANDLQSVMSRLDEQADKVKLPEEVLKELEVENWRSAFETLQLPPADEHNIGQWMEVIDSWAMPMIHQFGNLRRAVLAALLKSERTVASCYRGEEDAKPAPQPAAVPQDYPLRPRGSERVRQTKLDWWSRFTLADGLGPGVLRFVVAGSILAAVVLAGLYVGNSNVIIYNGLSIPVNVAVHSQEVTVSPFQHKEVSVGARRNCRIVARTMDGREIETFSETLDRAFANYVYNVAGAAPMVEWNAVYGTARQRDPDQLGFPRWRITGAKHIFTQPPRQIETSGSGGVRRVLSSDAHLPPHYAIESAQNSAERERVIRTHALWDSSEGQYINFWLMQASGLDDFQEILAKRFEANPGDVVARRVEQDTAKPGEKAEVLKRHRDLARPHPDDPDWQYLSIRAMPDGPEQDRAFVAAFEKWPEHAWLANAVAYHYSCHGKWQKALKAYERPLRRPGPWFDSAAIQVARIRRFLATEEPADLNDLKASVDVTTLIALETGENMAGSPFQAYSLMHKGKLKEAYQTAGGKNADPLLLVLLAASIGAETDWQIDALELDAEQFTNPAPLFYLAAMAHRNEKPFDEYLKRLEDLYSADDRPNPLPYVREFLEGSQASETLEADLTNLDPMGRGLVLATAIVMFPDKAQPGWRKTTNGLLFATERPLF